MATVSELIKNGLILGGNKNVSSELVVDFSRLEKVDSSAISLMLTWLREAQRNKIILRFTHVPPNLMSLAQLYGLAELLMLNQNQ